MDDRDSNYGAISSNDDGECEDDGQSEEENYDEKDLLISRVTDDLEENSWDAADAAANGDHACLGDQRLNRNSALSDDINTNDDPDLDSLKSDEVQTNFNETDDEAETGEDTTNTFHNSADDMVEMASSSGPVEVVAARGHEETSDVNYLPSNPFGNDDNDDSDDHDTPVKLTESSAQPSNPFGDDDDDDDENGPEMKEDIKRNVREIPPTKPERVKTPFNPFDDGEIEAVGSVAVEKILHRRKFVTESLAPVTVASMCNDRAISPSLSQFEVPSKKYGKEYQELMALGFDRVCIGNALQKSSGNVAIAMKMLSSRLFDDRVMSNDQLYVWKSPLLLRVGGWLPNVEDEGGSGAVHTSFYVNVTMTLGNQSWRIGRRYSEFYKLYSAVYNKLFKAFPSGMQNPFPADRLVNWISRTSQEEINDSRRKSLDSWFRELINYPQLMLDQPTRKAIYEFLQVEQNLAKMKGAAILTQSPPPIPPRLRKQASSTNTTQPQKISPATTVPETSRISGSVGPSSTPDITSTEESVAFNNRRKAALAAQRNDYKSPPSDGPDAVSKSEPSSSGFTDVPSKSFMKRLNLGNT